MSTAYDRLQPEIRKYYERYENNGLRVTNLITLADINMTGNASDVLRAAVVFLHATLEDFLRTICSDRAEKLDREKLSTLSLVGTDYSNKKFSLQSLLDHKDKNVGDLINESIRSWLRRTSFNETSDITGILTNFGV